MFMYMKKFCFILMTCAIAAGFSSCVDTTVQVYSLYWVNDMDQTLMIKDQSIHGHLAKENSLAAGDTIFFSGYGVSGADLSMENLMISNNITIILSDSESYSIGYDVCPLGPGWLINYEPADESSLYFVFDKEFVESLK